MTPNELSIEKILLILAARAWMIISIFIAAVIIAGFVTYVTPKMYTTAASLNFTFSASPVDSRGRSEFGEETYIATQMELIKSRHVAQKVEDSLTEYERERLIAALDARYSVIDELKSAIKRPIKALFSSKKSSEKSAGSTSTGNSETLEVSSGYGWLAQSIGSFLSVEPMPSSRIVQVSYTSTDRQVATLMANRFAEAYIETNLEMATDPARKSKTWFDGQLKSLRVNLEEAQSRLTAYQQEHRVISSDERLSNETSRLQDLSSRLVAAQQETRNAVSERQKLQEVLDSGASLTTFGPVFDNPVVQGIKAEIRGLQGRIAESASSLGANHPRMQKMNSELYAARQRLETEIKTITDGINNGVELSRQRERDLEAALEAQKQLVLDLKNEHDRIAVLQREVESAQATYNAALNQLNTTSMQSLIDQTNVSMVDRASFPYSHSSPKAAKNLVLGAMAGLLLGVGLAVFLEMLTRRVYSLEDLTAELGVPVLAHLKKA